MITLPQYQLPLIALLIAVVLRNGLRRRLVTACMLATLLAYAAYVLAIDVTGQIEQVRVFDRLPPAFVTANCTILASFTLCFLLGGWIVSRFSLAPPELKREGNGVLGPLVAGFGLVVISADGWWLFAPYPLNKGTAQLIPLGGAGAVANLLLLIGFNRAREMGQHLQPARAVFWLVVVHYVLAGDRGSLLFLLVGAYGFHLARMPRFGWREIPRTILLAAALLIALDQISYLRSWGMQSPSAHGTFLAEVDLLPQSVAHMFHAISIHLSGYQTFTGSAAEFLVTLWVQIIPSGLLHGLGVTLYNGPLMLSEFVVHGGGFFVPAELYFVGGFPALILIATYFGALAAWLDRLAQRSEDTLLVTLVLLVAASSFYTMYYGVQAVNRMLTLPVILLLARAVLYAILQRVQGQRAW